MSLKSHFISTAAGIGLAALPLVPAQAGEVTVGGGLRTSFTNVDYDVDDESGDDGSFSDFAINSARLYISGKATDNISFMFNTEYNSSNETMRVIDAVAQFSTGDKFNIWAGRFLPPSDRANLYGPYYASNWAVYQDGVQDGYPFETEGRDDGIAYWGQFDKVKLSVGAFDVSGLTTGDSDVLIAGRVQVDFWDPEAGYYLNGTYYGEKDLLALGVAAQTAEAGDAYSVDFLLEKKLGNAGVITVESEYAMYDGLGGYPSPVGSPYQKQDGWYMLGAYLFPGAAGPGKFQVLAKYGQANYDYGPQDLDQDTLELDVNYLIKTFNARISLYYLDKSFDPDVGGNSSTIGLGLQVQM
jgi:Phosphate-selective porin O and P